MAEADEVPIGVRSEVDAIAREVLELAKAEKSAALKAIAEKLHDLARKRRPGGGMRNRCPQCGGVTPAKSDRPAHGFRFAESGEGWECAHTWHDLEAET